MTSVLGLGTDFPGQEEEILTVASEATHSGTIPSPLLCEDVVLVICYPIGGIVQMYFFRGRNVSWPSLIQFEVLIHSAFLHALLSRGEANGLVINAIRLMRG